MTVEQSAKNHAAYLRTKANPASYARRLEQGRSQRNRARKWLADYKTARGCVDCGFNAHFAALHLDHEGHKAVEIADARSSIGRLQREIADGDCKVRCANCHSVRTWRNKQRRVIAGTGL